MNRKLPTETIVLAIALVVLVIDAGGGPGWGGVSAYPTIAMHLDRTAGAPLYDLLASVAVRLPAGEPGFRLALLGAILGALTLAGVVAASRAILPRDPIAGVIGALLLLITPAFRDAAAFATPASLATCGTIWAVALTAKQARDARDTLGALGACAIVVGSAPWLGVMLALAIAASLLRTGARKQLVIIGIGAIGLVAVVAWLDAVGPFPSATASLANLVTGSGRGAGAIVIGAGLLGVGFGALTGLRGARWLAIIVALIAAHEIVVGSAPPALSAVLAVGCAIVPSAITQAVGPTSRRQLVTLAAGVPLVGAALLVGPTLWVDDPGATPTQLAHDLAGGLPSGPGVVIATRTASWFALEYERQLAGARPDLALAPMLPASQADALAADTLRAGRIVGSDVAAFGRLDVRRAIPRGRGFELVSDPAPPAQPVSAPARYPTETGAQQAILLALERARYEAASGRLDAAARAAGLAERFGAADLAVLAATLPSPQRPALFGFLPLDVAPPGRWLLELFGDDLAWVAGIPQPEAASDAPMPRQLHALWQQILVGNIKSDDARIAALGPRALAATKTMLEDLRR